MGAFDGGDLHDFVVTDQGTALFTVYDPFPADLSGIGGPEFGWLYDGIFQEIDIATGELLFEWRASKYFQANVTYENLKARGRTRETAFDYFHINSVDKDSKGNYLISARHSHSVSYIDGQMGTVLWTLGGKLNDFTDLSDGAATNFTWQHDARWLDDNTITLFDNTAHLNRDPEASSRGMRIRLDSSDRTAELQAAYHHPQKLKSTSQGNMDVLDTGNVLIEWGHSAAYTEFTPEGRVVCDVHFGASAYYTFGRVVSYRAHKGSWIGRPQTNPNAAVARNSIYVSWNGATEVTAWQLQVWDGHDLDNLTFTPIVQVDKDGFETIIEIPDGVHERLFKVAALDSQGIALGTTLTIERPLGFNLKSFFHFRHWVLGIAFIVGGSGLLLGLYRCCRRFWRPWNSRSDDYGLVAMSENEDQESV